MTTPRPPLYLLSLLSMPLAYPSYQLVLLSPHWEGVRVEFEKGFQKRYHEETGRDVDFKWLDVGGTSEILKFVRSEFKNKPTGIGVDVFFGGGTDPYTELKKLGLLAPCPLPADVLKALPEAVGGMPMYDPDHCWYAATMAGFGIIYNKVVLKKLGLPEPKTWEDLGRPELLTWVGSGDPRKSGSVHMVFEIILQAYGWEKGWQVITAMGGNVRAFSSYGSQAPKDVAIGEVAYGMCIDSHAWQQVQEVGGEMIGFVMPQDLTVVNGDGIAILKGAPHGALAERFVRFVLSEEGQKLWILRKGQPDGPQEFELGKFSVLRNLYPKIKGRTCVGLNPFDWRSRFTYDAERGPARWGLVNDLVGTQLIDPHQALVAAWKKTMRGGDREAELARLGGMPVTEQEAARLASEGKWGDAEYRNRALTEWAVFARQKYGSSAGASVALRNLPAILAALALVAMVLHIRRQTAAR